MNPGYDRVTSVGYGARSAAEIDEGLRQYMLRVYNYLGSGLLLSGMTAYLTYSSGFAIAAKQGGLGLLISLAPLGFVLVMSFGMNRISAFTMQALYWGLTAVMGVSLSYILQVYTGVSVIRTLFVTAATFGVMSIYGYTTKKNLANWGTFLLMGLIGILIAGIVNIFLDSAMLHFVISAVGVLLFTALIAYDTQHIKSWFYEITDSETLSKMAVFGAAQLYINLVNLFQFLLAFLGERE